MAYTPKARFVRTPSSWDDLYRKVEGKQIFVGENKESIAALAQNFETYEVGGPLNPIWAMQANHTGRGLDSLVAGHE